MDKCIISAKLLLKNKKKITKFGGTSRFRYLQFFVYYFFNFTGGIYQ